MFELPSIHMYKHPQIKHSQARTLIAAQKCSSISPTLGESQLKFLGSGDFERINIPTWISLALELQDMLWARRIYRKSDKPGRTWLAQYIVAEQTYVYVNTLYVWRYFLLPFPYMYANPFYPFQWVQGTKFICTPHKLVCIEHWF